MMYYTLESYDFSVHLLFNLASVIALFCTYDYYDSYKLRKSTFTTFNSSWLVWPFILAA